MPDGVIEAGRDGLKRFWSEGGAGVQAVEYLLGPILWDATRVEVYQKEPQFLAFKDLLDFLLADLG